MEFSILCLPFIVSWCTDLADASLAFALVYFAMRNESKSLTLPCVIVAVSPRGRISLLSLFSSILVARQKSFRCFSNMGSSVNDFRNPMESSAKWPNLRVMFPISIPVIFLSLLMVLVKPSTIARKRIGDRGQPCAVPCRILNFLLRKPFDITCRLALSADMACLRFCYEGAWDEAYLVVGAQRWRCAAG
eukprot:2206837-Pleurochrysis_carterae.AAC.1